jgi:hypothetical protein
VILNHFTIARCFFRGFIERMAGIRAKCKDFPERRRIFLQEYTFFGDLWWIAGRAGAEN